VDECKPLVLGLVTCILALVAQFYPVKFPGNYTVLVVCVAGYCAFNTLLQLYITFVEKGMVRRRRLNR
jgi:signal peptidase complex subunit 2